MFHLLLNILGIALLINKLHSSDDFPLKPTFSEACDCDSWGCCNSSQQRFYKV